MKKIKSAALFVLLIFISVSCGTDGLQVDEKPLSFSNTNALSDADYIQAGQQYSFTVEVDDGKASNVNLTAFTDGGNWLKAKVVDSGSAIKLTGTPSNKDAGIEYSYSMTAITSTETKATTTFTVYVDN